jgi:hypothetical protein
MVYMPDWVDFTIWHTTDSSWQGEFFTWQSDVPFQVPSILSFVVCEEHEWLISKRTAKTVTGEIFLLVAFILICNVS